MSISRFKAIPHKMTAARHKIIWTNEHVM